jgi:hypothetical protein
MGVIGQENSEILGKSWVNIRQEAGRIVDRTLEHQSVCEHNVRKEAGKILNSILAEF